MWKCNFPSQYRFIESFILIMTGYIMTCIIQFKICLHLDSDSSGQRIAEMAMQSDDYFSNFQLLMALGMWVRNFCTNHKFIGHIMSYLV